MATTTDRQADQTIRALTSEEGALLRTSGFGFVGAEMGARRVARVFRDPSGEASAALERHNAAGIQVDSRVFCDSLSWAKRAVFQARETSSHVRSGGHRGDAPGSRGRSSGRSWSTRVKNT